MLCCSFSQHSSSVIISCDSAVTHYDGVKLQLTCTFTPKQKKKHKQKQKIKITLYRFTAMSDAVPEAFFAFHFPSIIFAAVKNYMPTAGDVAAVSSWSLPRKYAHTCEHTDTCAHKTDTNTTHHDSSSVSAPNTIPYLLQRFLLSLPLNSQLQHNFSTRAAQVQDVANTGLTVKLHTKL